ncbi:MAG: hypothetical protein J1F35_05865 [Erysipelotrichales bacterium]|nr:hypothetical protein [Erysipelotrichales bacterium]
MWWIFKKLKEIKNLDFKEYREFKITNASKEYKKKYRNNKNIKYIANDIAFGYDGSDVRREDRVLLYDKKTNMMRIAKVMTTPFGTLPPVFDGNETLVDYIIIAKEIK